MMFASVNLHLNGGKNPFGLTDEKDKDETPKDRLFCHRPHADYWAIGDKQISNKKPQNLIMKHGCWGTELRGGQNNA